MTDPQRTIEGKTGSFQLTMSEGLVHGCLWAYVEAEHHGSSDVWWGKMDPLMVPRKQRDQKGTQDQMEPAKASLSDLLLPVRYHL